MKYIDDIIEKISKKHTEKSERVQLIKDKKLPYVLFPKDNDIIFWQDFAGWQGVPDDRKFYPKDVCNGSVIFVADGYGILQDNKLGLKGKYGNGAIYIDADIFSGEVLEQALLNKAL